MKNRSKEDVALRLAIRAMKKSNKEFVKQFKTPTPTDWRKNIGKDETMLIGGGF